MNGYVYIIQSTSTSRYYIGFSIDVIRRINEHNTNQVYATRRRGPWEIRYYQEYPNLTIARKVENRLKKFKNRHIIERIIIDQSIRLEWSGCSAVAARIVRDDEAGGSNPLTPTTHD